MPVTKTAKRALKGSKRKAQVNKNIVSSMEITIRVAKKSKKESDVSKAMSLVDRANKKHVIHKNKAARIKSSLSKLLPKTSKSTKKPKTNKSTKAQKAIKKKK